MKSISIGMIGAGWIAAKHLNAIQALGPCAQITALCDRDERAARAVADAFGIEHVTADAGDVITSEQVNAVLVAVPTAFHAELAMAAAEAGKHVICEKPMSTSADHCRQMIDAAEHNGVSLMPVHNRIFFPPIVEAKRIADTGALGTLRLFRANFMTPYHAALAPAGEKPNWRADPARSGGGIMIEAGVHLIYTARHFMGSIRSVQAQMQAYYGAPVEDSASVQLEFGSGAIGVLVLQNSSGLPDDSVQIIGTDGTLIVNGVELQAMRGPALMHYSKKDEHWSIPPAEWSWEKSFAGFWRHVAEVLLDGVSPMLTGVDGRDTIATVEAAYRSARSGERVVVD